MPRTFLLYLFSAASVFAQNHPIVYTRVQGGPLAGGGRIVLRQPDGGARILSEGFHSAADPEVSFDGQRILFAARRAASDRWNIFEMKADGSGIRQVTREAGNCRSPLYVSAIFYLNDAAPVHQIAFVSDAGGESNLYTVRPDGSELRRLTYRMAGSLDPTMLPDGRILFSGWRGRTRADLFGVHHDGADYAAFSGAQGPLAVKRMAAVTAKGLVVFVESAAPDGAGPLSSVTLRRNLRSYKRLASGLFYSPAPLPDGTLLVSRRTPAGTHGIWRFDPATGRAAPVYDDPRAHEIQARAVLPRPEPDGHSSVVDEKENWAKLYCLNVYESDVPVAKGSAKKVRVIAAPKQVLGDVDIEDDGSFHIEIPPNLSVKLQLLDAKGAVLRATAWIWAKNKEQRGCIGCHEDGERTPENVMAQALLKPAPKLRVKLGEAR
jgi:hypothetical protein